MMDTQATMHVRLIEHYANRHDPADEYSRAFIAAAAQQGSAWSREVRLVIAIASQLGMSLDEDMLSLSDVRDLQALRTALTERLWRSKRV